MKIVLAGGSGSLGRRLAADLSPRGHEVVVLTRSPRSDFPYRQVGWDGATVGPWAPELDGAAIINLAGALVDRRPTPANVELLTRSRVEPIRALAAAAGTEDAASANARRRRRPVLVDESGDADPRWQPILEELHVCDHLAIRPGPVVRNQAKSSSVTAARSAGVSASRSGWEESVRKTRSRRAASGALKVFEEILLVGEPPKRAVGDLGPSELDGREHHLVTGLRPPEPPWEISRQYS